MRRKFMCASCNSDIVVEYLKPGEQAQCRRCGATAVVPDNALIVDGTAGQSRQDGEFATKVAELATPTAPQSSGIAPPQSGSRSASALETAPGATASLICGIAGIVITFGALALGIAAIIFGAKAKRAIRATPGRYGGRGRAQAGFILGIVAAALQVITLLAFVASAVITEHSKKEYQRQRERTEKVIERQRKLERPGW